VIKKCILDFGCWILNKRLYSTFKIQHSKLCFYKSVFTLTLNSEVTKIVIIPWSKIRTGVRLTNLNIYGLFVTAVAML